MTKKHFELIAETISTLPDGASREDIAWAFAEALRDTNARFDVALFVAAAQKGRVAA